jgi:2-polyprenyl-3-methyl-5-hydroxy-6-metoxy-1,4-benzoquinol methylase
MFSRRSYKKELLDHDNIPFSDIQKNMAELNFINQYLGGHRITVEGFKHLAGNRKNLTVCEIGCGGGDNLAAIYKWCNKRNILVSFIGIDIKKECIAFAKTRTELSNITNWITSDYSAVQFSTKPDVIFSSLFCHHFTDEDLVLQFKWMKQNTSLGFFVNDLHRNPIAYYSIKLLTQLFSKSYLVKNDAPLSVARGFKETELRKISLQSNIPSPLIIWKWAFRYLLIYNKESGKAL